MVRWKCFVPQMYQFRRSISGGPALKYFYMIHRSGREREREKKRENERERERERERKKDIRAFCVHICVV